MNLLILLEWVQEHRVRLESQEEVGRCFALGWNGIVSCDPLNINKCPKKYTETENATIRLRLGLIAKLSFS